MRVNQDAVHAHQVSYIERLTCSLQQCNFIPYVNIFYTLYDISIVAYHTSHTYNTIMTISLSQLYHQTYTSYTVTQYIIMSTNISCHIMFYYA